MIMLYNMEAVVYRNSSPEMKKSKEGEGPRYSYSLYLFNLDRDKESTALILTHQISHQTLSKAMHIIKMYDQLDLTRVNFSTILP